MTVFELNRDQINDLKDSLFYQFLDMDDAQPFAVIDPVLKGMEKTLLSCDFPDEIPDEIIFQVYDDICFVPDDFFC